jgi:CrcB protein
MRDLGNVLAVGLGGAIGTFLRYAVESAAMGPGASIAAAGAINLLGAFLIGLLTAILLERSHLSPRWRLLLTTGLLGGFTTFGSLMAQTGSLLAQGSAAWALALGFGEAVLGLACTLLGMGTARLLERRA